jgi:single-strand DNA-binding protein
MSVNKAILVGRLGKDPELRYTSNGRAVANFPLATDRRWKNQDGQLQSETTWHNIVVWGRRAEVINEYMSKGRQLFIEGRISNRSYDDKDGNKRWISEVVVETSPSWATVAIPAIPAVPVADLLPDRRGLPATSRPHRLRVRPRTTTICRSDSNRNSSCSKTPQVDSGGVLSLPPLTQSILLHHSRL